MVPSAASTGDLAMVPSCSPRETPVLLESTPEALEAPVQEMLGADGASLGTFSVKVDGANPWTGDDTGGSLYDLVIHGTGLDMLGSATSGDAIPAPGSSGAGGPRVAGLPLLGCLSFAPPPINWRRVEDDVEFMCL
jgi:hypothetical protein